MNTMQRREALAWGRAWSLSRRERRRTELKAWCRAVGLVLLIIVTAGALVLVGLSTI